MERTNRNNMLVLEATTWSQQKASLAYIFLIKTTKRVIPLNLRNATLCHVSPWRLTAGSK